MCIVYGLYSDFKNETRVVDGLLFNTALHRETDTSLAGGQARVEVLRCTEFDTLQASGRRFGKKHVGASSSVLN